MALRLNCAEDPLQDIVKGILEKEKREADAAEADAAAAAAWKTLGRILVFAGAAAELVGGVGLLLTPGAELLGGVVAYHRWTLSRRKPSRRRRGKNCRRRRLRGRKI